MTLNEIERNAVLSAICAASGDLAAAAKALGIGRTTIYRKVKEWGLADAIQGASLSRLAGALAEAHAIRDRKHAAVRSENEALKAAAAAGAQS